MAITKIELINKALTQVGASPIISLDDDTQNARVVNRLYDIALRSVLSETGWNFATRRKLLTISPDSPEWSRTNENYVYSLPINVIRILGVNDDNATWRVEGDYIYSDTEALGILYIAYIADTAKFPITFIDALADKLSAEIAYIIVNSSSLGDKYLSKYESVSLPNARSQNAQAGVQLYIRDDEWLNSRYGAEN